MSKSYHVTLKDLKGKTRTEINDMVDDPESILNELAKKSSTKKEVREQRKGSKILKNMKEEYKRISCDLYDQLEGYASLKKKLILTYFEDEVEVKEKIEIKTLETKDKSEYLITQSEKRIRLDQIASIIEI